MVVLGLNRFCPINCDIDEMTYRLLNAKKITLFYFEIYSILTSQTYTQLEDLFQCIYRRPDTF